jgi:hypothetical protein
MTLLAEGSSGSFTTLMDHVPDLVRTVAVAPTLNNVLVLGLIVVIRTALSFSLETEIEGVAPWRRALTSGAGTLRRASGEALRTRPDP